MCRDGKTCDCWDAGYSYLLKELRDWSEGQHALRCGCESCVVAASILKRALHRLGDILEELGQDPPDSGQKTVGGGQDF